LLQVQRNVVTRYQQASRQYVKQKDEAKQNLAASQKSTTDLFESQRNQIAGLEQQIRNSEGNADNRLAGSNVVAKYNPQLTSPYSVGRLPIHLQNQPEVVLVNLKDEIVQAANNIASMQSTLLLWKAGQKTLWIVLILFILAILAVAIVFFVVPFFVVPKH